MPHCCAAAAIMRSVGAVRGVVAGGAHDPKPRTFFHVLFVVPFEAADLFMLRPLARSGRGPVEAVVAGLANFQIIILIDFL